MTGFLATMTLALTTTTGQADGVLLRWKLKEGDVVYAKTVTALEQTVTAMGRDIEQKQDQTTVHRYKVLKASDSGYTVEQTVLQSITESNIAPGGLGDLDKKLKGSTVTVEMDAKFKVKKIAGVAELVKKLGDDNALLKQVLSSFLNEDLMKHGVEVAFRCGPDKAVKVDDVWKTNETVPLGAFGEMTMKMDYKLTKSKDGEEEIAIAGEAKYGPPKEAVAGAPFTISKGDLKSEKYTGTMIFDSKAGRPKESKTEMKLGGSMTAKIGELEIDMDIKQTMKQTTTISDKNPVVD